MNDRLAELPKDSRLLLMEAQRTAEARDQIVASKVRGTSEIYSVSEAEFMLSIRRDTLLKLREVVEARDPAFTDFTDGEVRLMNDSLPVSFWR